MGLRPYRCESCGCRFRHRRVPEEMLAVDSRGDDVRAREPFVSADTDEFSELIREISAAEHSQPADGPPQP